MKKRKRKTDKIFRCPFLREGPTLSCNAYKKGLKVPSKNEQKVFCRTKENHKNCLCFKEVEDGPFTIWV